MSGSSHQPPYRVFNVNLTNARTFPGEMLVAPGEQIESLIPLDIPAGLGITVAFGDNADPIPLEFLPSIEICPAASAGLRFVNIAAAGQFARFIVGFADSIEGT